MFRSLGALIGDALIVVLFVSAGLIQHGTPLSSESLFVAAWPFVAGLLLGHLAIRSWRAPFSLWPHGVFVWAITVAAAMALRSLLGQGTETSFVIVTAAVTGVGMLGWRALAMYLTRGERRAATARAANATTAGAAAHHSSDQHTSDPGASPDPGASSGPGASSISVEPSNPSASSTPPSP